MPSESTPLTALASQVLTEDNARAAGSFAKEKLDELRKQVQTGDFSIRLMALIGGTFLVFVSATQFLGKALTLNFIGAILDIYTFAIGIIIIILEGGTQIPMMPASWLDTIHKYALILKYVWGRGALYVIAGTLQLSQRGLLDLIVGGFLALVGVIYIIVGRQAQAKLKKIKAHSMSSEELKVRFAQADAKGNGKLDNESFKALTMSMGMDLNRRENEAAFLALDKDGDGFVSLEEVQGWWGAIDEPGPFHLI